MATKAKAVQNLAADEIVKQAQVKYTICLITGSMDLYARVIAEKLNVKNGMTTLLYTGTETTN